MASNKIASIFCVKAQDAPFQPFLVCLLRAKRRVNSLSTATVFMIKNAFFQLFQKTFNIGIC